MTRLADGGDPMFKVKKSLVYYTAQMQNTFRQRTGVATRESSRCRIPGMPVNTSGERPLILAGHNSLSSVDLRKFNVFGFNLQFLYVVR